MSLTLRQIANLFFTSNTNGYMCMTCKNVICVHGRILSNLKTHMIKQHKQKLTLFQQNNVTIQQSKTSVNYPQHFINFFGSTKYPISMIRDPNFRKLVSCLNNRAEIPSIEKVNIGLKNIFIELKNKIINDLQKFEHCSIFIDLWSYKNRVIGGITLRYFCGNKLITGLLSLCELGNAKSETVCNFVNSSIQDFGINKNQIITTVTDNCHSMKKFSSMFLYNESEIEFQEETPQILLDMEVNNNLVGKQVLVIGCHVHLLNLVLQKWIKRNATLSSLVEKVIENIKIFNKFRNKEKSNKIPLPFWIRWNSLFISIDKFVSNLEKIDTILHKNNFEDNILKDEEKTILYLLKIILKEFNDIIKKMEADDFYFLTFYEWYEFFLKKMLLKMKNDTDIPTEFIHSIKQLEEHFHNYFSKEKTLLHEYILVAKYLSPKSFQKLAVNERNKAKSIILSKCIQMNLQVESEEEIEVDKRNNILQISYNKLESLEK